MSIEKRREARRRGTLTTDHGPAGERRRGSSRELPDSLLARDAVALEKEIAARVRWLPARTTAAVRAVRREFSRRLARSEAEIVMRIADRLIARGDFMLRFVAYELVAHHAAARARLRAANLARLGRDLSSWEAVDTFALYLAGPAWREEQVSDAEIHRWAKSKDPWRRRAALASTVALNSKARGGRGDALRTLDVCRLLIDDRDGMVVKAMSWALRELAKRDARAVREFLERHESELAARVLREVRNKLTTGRKNPRG